ncbi:NAD(P)H-dependent oxidoreductase [Reichenbachiella sp. MALMAid0571]|uniref:NADPH-dependent FMN reductase n=1 Tax=Reichenbachiella sp. MALMAid0571 TaxID=3143939 RepID=UPI0032DE822D
MNIAIIVGSVRRGRQTPKAAKYLQKELLKNEKVTHVEYLDLAEYNFPIMEERNSYLDEKPDRLEEFSQKLSEADALVIVSPEYNGSMPGVLKNTLDYFHPEFSKKPIGLLTVSSGNMGGINVHHDLQKFILHIRAYAVPMKYLLTKVQSAFDEDGKLTDEYFEKSTGLFIQELTWLAEAIKNQKSI